MPVFTYLKEPIPTPEEVSREVAATVSQIIAEVERDGTDAVRRHSVRLDGPIDHPVTWQGVTGLRTWEMRDSVTSSSAARSADVRPSRK